jgi:hypothetical protein
MPKPMPLSQQTRDAVEADIRAGLGRNAIARAHGISAGSVTNIARSAGLWFDNDWRTTTATEAHRIDAAAARLDREEQLWNAYLNHQARYTADGRETKGSARERERLSYKLYDLDRHHR